MMSLNFYLSTREERRFYSANVEKMEQPSSTSSISLVCCKNTQLICLWGLLHLLPWMPLLLTRRWLNTRIFSFWSDMPNWNNRNDLRVKNVRDNSNSNLSRISETLATWYRMGIPIGIKVTIPPTLRRVIAHGGHKYNSDLMRRCS